MGSTRPTDRNQLQEIRSDWRMMGKWRRKQSQPAYHRLWEHAEAHADTAGETNPCDPMRGGVTSMCLGQQLEIAALEERLAELEHS